MEIIAKSKDGFLISAKNEEVMSILSAVNGANQKDIEIGQKIPAIDYSSTITKIKTLNNDYQFKQIFSSLKNFNESAKDLLESVVKAQDIEG